MQTSPSEATGARAGRTALSRASVPNGRPRMSKGWNETFGVDGGRVIFTDRARVQAAYDVSALRDAGRRPMKERPAEHAIDSLEGLLDPRVRDAQE